MNLNLPFSSFLLEETTQILDREAETEGSKEKVTCGKKAGKGNGHHTSPQELEGGEEMPWGRSEPGHHQHRSRPKGRQAAAGVCPVISLFLWQTLPHAACF